MPIYDDKCVVCGVVQEEIRSLHAPQPEHCGKPMVRQLGTFVQCWTTKGGNLMHHNVNRTLKGNRKPKTVGKGHGIGGRRKPPSMQKLMELSAKRHGVDLGSVQAEQAKTIAALKEKKK